MRALPTSSADAPARRCRSASAILLDTRNGYVYGTAEATEKRFGITNAWFSEAAADGNRIATETAAFNKLVTEIEHTWTGVVKQYAGDAPKATAESNMN